MPVFETSQEWFNQSSLLLKARPTTTRITSKYTILKPKSTKVSKRSSQAKTDSAAGQDGSAAPTPPPATGPKGAFVLKTYDPESGTCFKYETNKAAEVGRLVSTLGRLARHMAALPEISEDIAMLDVPSEQGPGTSTPAEPAAAISALAQGKQSGAAGGGGGGGKKKKKGKK